MFLKFILQNIKVLDLLFAFIPSPRCKSSYNHAPQTKYILIEIFLTDYTLILFFLELYTISFQNVKHEHFIEWLVLLCNENALIFSATVLCISNAWTFIKYSYIKVIFCNVAKSMCSLNNCSRTQKYVVIVIWKVNI